MDAKTYDVVEIPQPDGRCNDHDPNWVGDTIYFRSDRGGEYNVHSFKPNGKKPELAEVAALFVRDITQFDAIHEIRRQYFATEPPASTMVQVSEFVHRDMLIEINAVAALS